MKILFLGAPGSGKSTQGKLLAKERGFDWISSGQLFRESGDPEILKILATAQLIDDEKTGKMVLGALLGKENVILDGFPRNLRQCEILEENGVRIDLIVEIDVDEEELMKRMLSRGREQDVEEVIRERIGMYRVSRDEILEFFRRKGVKIIKIDGNGTVEEVFSRVKKEVE